MTTPPVPPEPSVPVSFVDYLLGEYEKQFGVGQYTTGPVRHFRDWCNQYLQTNQPTAVTNLPQGLALILQDNTTVLLVPTVNDGSMAADGSVPISHDNPNYSRTEQPPTHPITKPPESS